MVIITTWSLPSSHQEKGSVGKQSHGAATQDSSGSSEEGRTSAQMSLGSSTAAKSRRHQS